MGERVGNLKTELMRHESTVFTVAASVSVYLFAWVLLIST